MSDNDRKQIAFLLYPGLTPLDLIGPLQTLATGIRRSSRHSALSGVVPSPTCSKRIPTSPARLASGVCDRE
jgi:hypothetical protein